MVESSGQHNIEGFLARLNGESPRSRILLEAGLLEELLRKAIFNRLAKNKSSEDLFGKKYSLGLAVLAKYAHALGLVGEHEVTALKRFADARNKIAHSWHADFSDDEIQKIANSIQLINIVGEQAMLPHLRCFSRLDYLGAYLSEEFLNRFANMPPTAFGGGVFLSSIVVDPTTDSRTKKVSSR